MHWRLHAWNIIVTFLQEKKHWPTSQMFPFDIIRATYFCRAAVNPNSMRVCPEKAMLPPIPITLFRSVLKSPLIRRFPAGGNTRNTARVSCICWWENALSGRWDMSRRKPIKEFPTAAKKTTFASSELRYTSQRTSGSVPASRNQCIRRQRFIIICRGEPFVVLFRYT